MNVLVTPFSLHFQFQKFINKPYAMEFRFILYVLGITKNN